MSKTPNLDEPRRLWIPLVAFLALSVFMYVTIMYKIINYGP